MNLTAPTESTQLERADVIDLPAGVSPAGFVERAGPGAVLQSESPIGTSLPPRPAQSDVCPYCVLEGAWNRAQESGALAAEVRAGLRRVMTCVRHS